MISEADIKAQSSLCGIYIFWQDAVPIYVGKAINLKARLLSHFKNADHDAKESRIIELANRITTIETNSEFNALVLEAQLIKKYRPKYNIAWKDDKSYLYIKISIKDEYPKITIVRKEHEGKALYFGPFGSQRVARGLISVIRKVIPFCTQPTLGKSPCFYAKIGQCNPCPNYIEKLKGTDPEKAEELQKEYKQNIRKVIKLLNGQSTIILKDLEKKLKLQTQKGEYEKGIKTRNKIFYLTNLIAHCSFNDLEDQLISEENKSEILEREADEFFKSHFGIEYDNPLLRIECYDISNLNGTNATASMVVFSNGSPEKKSYRKFKIKTVKQISDFWMLEEVLKRRFKHKEWPFPQLIVIDGGKPQVRIVKKALAESEKGIPLIGLAKNPDRIILSTGAMRTLWMKQESRFFQMLRYMRDESHRFAKKYHLQLRGQKLVL